MDRPDPQTEARKPLLPPPVLLLMCAGASALLAVHWMTGVWALILGLATLAAVAAIVPRLGSVYSAGVLILFFCLGHVAGIQVASLRPVADLWRPDLYVAVMSVVRTAVIGAGLLLAGAGRNLKVSAGRAPVWWWAVAAIAAVAMGAWYRNIFFPRLGFHAFSWYLPPDPAWQVMLAAGLSSLIRAAADELAFRGWLQGALEGLSGSEAALWAQALLSGILYYNPVMQPFGVSGLLVMTGVGLVLGAARRRTGGILFGVLVLTAVNLAVFWS